jgi:hypothetical protein
MSRRVSTGLVRGVVFAVCVIGIGGMVAGSISDDNALAMTFGLTTAVAVAVLMATTWLRTRRAHPEKKAKVPGLGCTADAPHAPAIEPSHDDGGRVK